MKEQLVTKQTGELALQKGFFYTHIIEDNGINIVHVYNDTTLCTEMDYNPDFYDEEYPDTPAPTQAMLQRWLREKHGILIHVITESTLMWEYIIQSYHPQASYTGKTFHSENLYTTYEEALESGLLEGLKLIK